MGLIPDVVANTPILPSWGNPIRDQTVMPFTNAAERTTQWTAPPEGAVSYLRDTDTLWYYNGTTWIPTAGVGYGCRLRRNSAFSVPNNAFTRVPMDTVINDTGGFYNAGSGGAVVPAGLGGLYVASVNVQFPLAFWIGGNVSVQQQGVGALATHTLDWMRSGTQWQAYVNVTMSVRLNTGADIGLGILHISGGAASLGFSAGAAGNVPVNPTVDLWRVSA
jgi:hypothetical protein